MARDMAARITACAVALRSVEFGGAVPAEVPVEAFHAAAPGLVEADWVIPRGLDRHGLELLVLTPDGTVAVRLSFPDGPVSSLEEVPASIRTALTCRCRSGPGHEYRHRQSRRAAGE